MSDADDRLIWSIPTGSFLTCARDLVMQGTTEVACTAGRIYKVDSMHPIADPPFLRIRDDQGQLHTLEAGDLREYFGR